MGIELGSNRLFDGRCDGCDTRAELQVPRAISAQFALRQLGWRRGAYIVGASHYTWLCVNCRRNASLQEGARHAAG